MRRWEKMNLPLHCLAYALCPKFYHQQYLNTPAPGGTIRQAPNTDKEVMTNVLEAFSKIADSSREQVLREQFNAFIMKKGMFALPPVQLDAFTIEPIEWWVSYGSETPDLAEVAKKFYLSPSAVHRPREFGAHSAISITPSAIG